MERDRDILLVSIFTFITVGLWIFFDLVTTTKQTTVTTTATQSITPLNPALDTDIFTTLTNKKTY